MARTRVDESEILMGIARLWATRGTCSRLQVGCVLVREGRVVASGYNGNCAGEEHCSHSDNSPCVTAVHSEQNAINFAAKYGLSTNGCTLYCTHQPCYKCSSSIINAGIVEVVYEFDYRDTSGVELLERHIKVRKFNV